MSRLVSHVPHPTRPVRLVVRNPTGWVVWWTAHRRTQGGGDGWRRLAAARPHPDGVTVVDLRPLDPRRLFAFALDAPMVDPDLPAGTIDSLDRGRTQYRPTGHRGYLGSNASALTSVAIDVYADLARRAGAQVTVDRPQDLGGPTPDRAADGTWGR